MVNWAKGDAKTLPDYALRLVIMREMHWDYWTYRAQPAFVIEQLTVFLNSEAEGLKPPPREEYP